MTMAKCDDAAVAVAPGGRHALRIRRCRAKCPPADAGFAVGPVSDAPITGAQRWVPARIFGLDLSIAHEENYRAGTGRSEQTGYNLSRRRL